MSQKLWSVLSLNKKIHVLLSQMYCVLQVVKTPTIILNNSVYQKTLPKQWKIFKHFGNLQYRPELTSV